MLNGKNERELCYLVLIDEIHPIQGKDRVECAVVGGWTVMVKKGQFKPGDVGIYFEIDSKLPAKEPFEFLSSKHYTIKTQRYKAGDGVFYSQGLLMHPSDFGWITLSEYGKQGVLDENGHVHYVDNDSKFLTKQLGITYYVKEDNKRKANSITKYDRMIQRHRSLFNHFPYSWLIKKEFGKKILFVFYGKKKDKWGWPDWVKKTDEERVENMPWVLSCTEPWVATEKIDGASATFTIKRNKIGKPDFFVCSRNVCFDTFKKANMDLKYFDTNIYLEIAEKYNLELKLLKILDNIPNAKWVTLQGEIYGKGVQKNTYGLEERELAIFNFVTSDKGRWGTLLMKDFLDSYEIPTVPVLNVAYRLPKSVEKLREYVRYKPSVINGEIKEGIVFRSLDGGKSFKCVDPEYLSKWH